ncbi:transposase family protein [Luteolibacter arcticus]|uniref:Transposase family protein n=1 Tax=Luteolibacter arcticus TaxID=1581411 RepID=A0ABT3GNC5_9BACT|nr:transposase family protein [Luteolibacter arcticus]MCW1925030.1 transposase family protein [Luteolibacter arcticus]
MARKKTRSEEYAGGFPAGMEAFQSLTDHRDGKAKRHYFGGVLFIAHAAMTCGTRGQPPLLAGSKSHSRRFTSRVAALPPKE